MKTRVVTFQILLSVLLWPFFSYQLAAQLNPKLPPTPEDFVGAWAGYDNDCLDFYRISLGKNSQGHCEVVHVEKPVHTYKIDHWEVVARNLVIPLLPNDWASESIKTTVTYFDPLSLHLTITASTGKWEAKATLYNEREFLKRLNKCKAIEKKR